MAFDGTTPLPRAAFRQLLDLTLPRPQVPPFDLWNLPVCVHLVLFVHRVTELEPGLYLWMRDLQQLDALRAAFRPDFLWRCELKKGSSFRRDNSVAIFDIVKFQWTRLPQPGFRKAAIYFCPFCGGVLCFGIGCFGELQSFNARVE